MVKNIKTFLILGLLLVLFLGFVSAENLTTNDSDSNISSNGSIVTGAVVSGSNDSVNQTMNSSNNTVNQTLEIPAEIYQTEISILSIYPKEFKIGDNQFNVQIQNNRNFTLKNVALLVTGKGFSTSDVVPIDSLDAGEKGYVLIMGNFKEAGNITLTIRENQDVFYYNISVIGASNQAKTNELQAQQDNAALIQNYTQILNAIKQNYTSLENTLASKKDDSYDVSKISLDDLKKYIRTVQTSLLTGDISSAKVNLDLAASEYADQKVAIDSVQKIPFLNRVKDNLALVGAIAASILTLFTFYELVKKKKKEVSETIASKLADKKKKK